MSANIDFWAGYIFGVLVMIAFNATVLWLQRRADRERLVNHGED